MSAGGLRSVSRTIQEKSAPISTISRTVNDDLLTYVQNEPTGDTIKSVFSPSELFYLITFTVSNVTYCFDMRTPMQDGSYRPTTWSGIRPRSYLRTIDHLLYIGQPGFVGVYTGYSDNGTQYRMSWYGTWLDFGDPIRTSVLKKINMTLVGTLSQQVVYKWGFDYTSATSSRVATITDNTIVAEYNIAEYGIAEYNRNLVIKSLGLNGGGAGKVVQVGMECQIIGYPISIQRVDVYTKDGAYK